MNFSRYSKTCENIPSNYIEDVFDKSIYGNWMMYGSYKKDEVEKDVRYELSRVLILQMKVLKMVMLMIILKIL